MFLLYFKNLSNLRIVSLNRLYYIQNTEVFLTLLRLSNSSTKWNLKLPEKSIWGDRLMTNTLRQNKTKQNTNAMEQSNFPSNKLPKLNYVNQGYGGIK